MFAYESMVAPGSRWVLTFNSGDAYPHMAAYNGSPNQWFWQNYVGP